MENKRYLHIFYETILVIFLPFLIVLSIEFVLKLGMGPNVRVVSFFPAIYASIITFCSFVWIRKKIIYALIPILLSSVVFAIFNKNGSPVIVKGIYFFVSLFVLSFFSVFGYALSKVIATYKPSRIGYFLRFFTGLFVFVCGMILVYIFSGFQDPETTIVKSILYGLGNGFPVGCGVISVIMMLSEKVG